MRFSLTILSNCHQRTAVLINPRINNQDKIYQEIPQDYTCEFTQDKDTLDNVKISDRLDTNLLDPFRNNPYTQSLASFA